MSSFEGRRLLLKLGRPLLRPRDYGTQLQFLIKKITNVLFSCSFFSIFDHKNPSSGPGRYSALNAGSESRLNDSGSETLVENHDTVKTPEKEGADVTV
jgi:hypothetical protein